jgi:pyruvate,water dikinase
MKTLKKWIRWFDEIGRGDVPVVGGKSASLGELTSALSGAGVRVPEGFALTAQAYWDFLEFNGLKAEISHILDGLDREDLEDFNLRATRLRDLILAGTIPSDILAELQEAYRELCRHCGKPDQEVAVRSSATAEDLPSASFAGQQESFLHVRGSGELEQTVKRCMASLFTARAISYRQDMGFDHMKVGLSVGVQRMVKADTAASGVMFTLDTESGFRDVVLINSIYGLGENIVQGKVGPDEFYIHKPTLGQGYPSIIWRKRGAKELRLAYDPACQSLQNSLVPPAERELYSLGDSDLLQLARWAVAIERHYGCPMDIEWAKDGDSGELFIVQARPETVHSQRHCPTVKLYELKERGQTLIEGVAVGDALAIGTTRLVTDTAQMSQFQPGEVLVTHNTDPDWEPIMKKAGAIVTERGGRTSHAAIVARELGIPAVVGAVDAIKKVSGGQRVTVSCVEGEIGRVYQGELEHSVTEVDPAALPPTRTKIMMNVGSPEQAFRVCQLPHQGVGLARMEFIFASWVRVHPLALTRYDKLSETLRQEVDRLTRGYTDKVEYFVDKLSQGIAVIAAAFWPQQVILRFSDFKTNEYAHLVGGAPFEPHEENPMLGWRGASRYYHPQYKEGFMLELAAVKRVREQLGLINLAVMVPFCRTPEEGRRVLETMAEGGLRRGENGLEVYVMAELPSNILQADEFAEIFDGFSIGSNDLTQLTLGVDRDSERVAPLFDERNSGVKKSCVTLIQAAHRRGRKVGICGQAPSDYPDFAAFLVEQGIDSISLTPDAILPTTLKILEIERIPLDISGAQTTDSTSRP